MTWKQLIAAMAVGTLWLLASLVSSDGGELLATWTEPTTNTDGSQLTDLAEYRLYHSSNQAQLTPCQNATLVVRMLAPASTPPPQHEVSSKLLNLTQGTTYWVSVTAVDSAGGESACSALASAAARPDPVVPTVFTDDFNRPNDQTLGPNWKQSPASFTATAGIVNQQIRPMNVGSGIEMLVTSVAPGPTQRAQIQLANFTGSTYGDAGVVLRASLTARTFYVCDVEKNGSAPGVIDTVISVRTTTSFTTLNTSNTVPWANGDILECVIDGNNLVMRRNGNAVLNVTDPLSTFADGTVGVRMREDGADNGVVVLDNFTGGAVVAPPDVAPNAPSSVSVN